MDLQLGYLAIGSFSQDDLWKQAEREVYQELSPQEQVRMKKVDCSDSFEAYIESHLRRKLGSMHPMLVRVRKTAQLLRPFGVALDILATGSGIPSGSLWGLMTLVVEVTEKHTEICEVTFGMLEQLLEIMPRFNSYLRFLPGNMKIQQEVVGLYREFMLVAVKAIRYFGRKHTISILFKLTWTRKRRDFKDSFSRIKNLSATVEERLRYETTIHYMTKHEEDMEEIRDLLVPQPRLVLAPASNPSPSSATAWSNIPYSRNKNFHGREDILSRIYEFLSPQCSSDEEKLNFVTIYGLGGIGKTQIALEYAHRHRGVYKARFWVTMDTPENASRGFREIAKKLDIEDVDDLMTQSRVKDWFADTGQWLLICDNTERLEDIRDYWPAAMRGSILLTSQNPNWIAEDEVDEAIKVEALSTEDGSRWMGNLLRKHIADPDQSLVTALVTEVGGHPLAIRQMASYIAMQGTSLATLLSLYQSRKIKDSVWAQGVGYTYCFTVATVWKLSFDALDSHARFLLSVLALLNPDKIPERLFVGGGDDKFAIFESRNSYEMAIGNLKRYSLVDRDDSGDSLSIHRLVKRYALSCMDSGELSKAFYFAIEALRRVYPRRSPLGMPLTGHWPECDRYIAHLMSLIDELEVGGEIEIPAGTVDLLIDGALYLWERGKLLQGNRMTQAAMDIHNSRENDPQGSLLLADIYSYHACILHDQGETKKAFSYFLEESKLRRTHLKSRGRSATITDEIQLANAYNNLAGIYSNTVHYHESLKYHQLSISLKKRWPENEVSYMLGVSFGNLANVYGQLEKWSEAEKLYKKALSVDLYTGFPLKKALTLHNFGSMQVCKGAPKDALPLLTESLRIRIQVLGDHHDTANTLHMMSTCHRQLENNKEAIELLKEAIRMLQSFGANELRIARSTYALSLALEKEGIITAMELREEAIQNGKRVTEERGQEYVEYFAKGEGLERAFDGLVAYI